MIRIDPRQYPDGLVRIIVQKENPNNSYADAPRYYGVPQEVADALAENERLREALPDADKLRLLADWVDLKYPNDPNPEVQTDLRKWAVAIDAARKP